MTTSGPVMVATAWPTNADLIADCARLGYLRPEWRTLDPTYGRGVWWKKWRPDDLVTNDRDRGGWDFRDIPHPDGTFDAVAYDPPYVCVGGRATTAIPEFHNRFGLHDTPRQPAALQQLIDDGLAECHRVVRPGGVVLVKCQDYVSSGALWLGTHPHPHRRPGPQIRRHRPPRADPAQPATPAREPLEERRANRPATRTMKPLHPPRPTPDSSATTVTGTAV